jgi:selenium-binding protein 1
MIQLSLDGKRLYVTTSLFSTWDNQFYPDIRQNGGCMLMVDCDAEKGACRSTRISSSTSARSRTAPPLSRDAVSGGDCTSDIWL